jgi:hypothetical protein
VVLALAAAWGVVLARGSDVDRSARGPEAALCHALSRRGLACDAADVVWVDPRRSRALVRATSQDDPSDLYLVRTELSPEGVLLRAGDSWNLTGTSGVDESRPQISGRYAAYTTAADGLVTAVHVLDLAGRSAPRTELTHLQRVQVALTNLQQTGQTAGVAHAAFPFDPVAREVTVAWRDDATLEVHADGRTVLIDPREPAVLSGAASVRVVPDAPARPGNLLTWAVDRVRAMSWFGDDRMQAVKAVTFLALDRVRVLFAGATTAQDVRDELGLAAGTASEAPALGDPEIRWPPAPMKPPISPALPGEGRWIALDQDRFISPTPAGTVPAFVTSFVRPTPARPDVRVYMTLWDPRQVGLHMEAGTVEPTSATGEHGPGLIPRAPEVIRHVVAAFNGGFQAMHGEYGMAASGIEYLPPKPYAATVVELRDGSNAFGAWPAAAEVPPDVVAFRQNLTALVEDGRFNPWGRTWWGGTPPGWPDQVHSARSALCLTAEGYIGYFYGSSLAADDLAQGLLVARCSFGIHLDMNPGHAGFEFYDVAPAGHLEPLGRPLQGDWEAEGKVPDMPGYVFRSRRMIRGMGHMLFPRYIQREARDFFYLTSRSILPGAPLVPPALPAMPGEGAWRTAGLPQHGFPSAIAASWVRADARRPDVRLRVLRADPRMMRPEPLAGTDAGRREGATPPVVLALVAPIRGSISLWWWDDAFVVAPAAPGAGAFLLAAGQAERAHHVSATTAPRAEVGVEDEDGMLVWVELPPDVAADAGTTAAMDATLERLGCSARFALAGDARALPGGFLDATGQALAGAPPPVTVRLERSKGPDARAIFTETPVVPPRIWQPLQAKRVRYFPKPAASSAP